MFKCGWKKKYFQYFFRIKATTEAFLSIVSGLDNKIARLT